MSISSYTRGANYGHILVLLLISTHMRETKGFKIDTSSFIKTKQCEFFFVRL